MKKVIINNEHDRYLYVADEVVFEVTHLATTGGIPEAIRIFLGQGESEWRGRLQQPNADSRIITFSSPIQPEDFEIFSLIPLRLNENIHDPLDPSPVDVLILLNDAYTELGDNFPIELTDENGNSLGISLVSISPNWLASDLHHAGNTGGPGSMPARKNLPADAQRKFKLKGRQPPLVLQHKHPFSGEGVQVAILDTAIPLDTEFEINKDTDHSDQVNFSDVGVKEVLTGEPTDSNYPYLEVVLYPYPNELSQCDPYATWPHHYEMPDHGTFIASIVRVIAPSVKIYLYEVLNRFGAGSLISIAQGVVNAVNQRGNNTIPVLVMNCSFMLEHDLEDLALVLEGAALQALQELLPPESEDMKPEQKEKRERNQQLLELSMRDVFKWAMTPDLNVVIVAAAGNDGKDENENRIPPHYPAAFENVLSVAALPKGNFRYPQNGPKSRQYKPATYSNLAHSPGSGKEAYSFATFGGDLVDNSSRPIGGVLGVYIGGIPTQNADGTFNPGPANTTGWAQWSGTSFATPIIAALLAARDDELESDNPHVPVTDPLIPERPYLSENNENVILIRQGP